MGVLVLELRGETIRIEPGRTLTFGRAGDLVVDADNRYLHRVLGCFAAQGDAWFLQNLGRHTTLHVVDAGGRSLVELPPAAQTSIDTAAFVVAFEAGPVSYEIRGEITG